MTACGNTAVEIHSYKQLQCSTGWKGMLSGRGAGELREAEKDPRGHLLLGSADGANMQHPLAQPPPASGQRPRQRQG